MFSARKSITAPSVASFIFIVGAILGSVPAPAGELGRCYSAEVPDPVVLPDGSSHPPGSLRICLSSKESPVRGRHVTSVDGRAIGAFQSRLGFAPEAAAQGGTAYFVFRRNGHSQLVLLGYAAYLGDRWHTYRMAQGPAALVAFEGSPIKAPKDTVLLAAAKK